MNNQSPSEALNHNEVGAAQRPIISQPTRQLPRARKSAQKLLEPVISGEMKTANVPSISNVGVACRMVEKTAGSDHHDHLVACDTLTKMELRRRYRAEANSHRNMLSRQNSLGAIVHSDFHEFVSFLRHLGPMPAKGATLDRIDNTDPEYAPGKVRWADKRTQNNNKSDTRIFHYSPTGDTYTASRLAKLQGVQSGTVRTRSDRGWTDDEVIEGCRTAHSSLSGSSPANRPSWSASIVSREASAREIMFGRLAAEYRRSREEDDEEALQAPLEELNKDLPPGIPLVTPEQYERHFARSWPDHRPHVNYARLPVAQQALIAKIDPQYVAELVAKAAKQSELFDQL